MRSSFVGTLLLTILLSAGSGCQQTTGPTAGTPTTPIGPLAPNGMNSGAAGPSLGPFGAPTRVPPPATGSYSTPNNYLGGTAPGGSAFSPTANAQNYASVGGRLQPLAAPHSATPLQPVGSGIRQTGWSDDRAAASDAGRPSRGAPTGTAHGPARTSQPQLGGMRVNDLTGAPPPPGYAPSQFRSGGQMPATGGAGAFRGYRQPSTANGGFSSSGVADVGTRSAARGAPAVGGTTGASAAMEASPRTAVPMNPSASLPAWRGGGELTAQGPSTEPAAPEDNQDSNLPWRRPGSQY